MSQIGIDQGVRLMSLDLAEVQVGDRGLATFVCRGGSKPICEHSHGLNQGSTTLVLQTNGSCRNDLIGHPIPVVVTSQSKTLGRDKYFFVEPIN